MIYNHQQSNKKKINFFTFIDEPKQIIQEILASNPDFELDEKNYEYLFVLGGDGTFLHALNKFKNKKIKIILINYGHLGFLANCDTKIKLHLDECEFETYSLLRLKAKNITKYAINEMIVFNLNTSVNISVSLNNEYFYKFFASGLVISSSYGSTGYNRSTNGPILKNKNLFLFSELEPSKYTNTQTLNQSLVLTQNDKLSFYLDKTDALFIKIDGRSKPFKVDEFEIDLVQSKAKMINFFKTENWIQKIQRTLIGGSNETK